MYIAMQSHTEAESFVYERGHAWPLFVLFEALLSSGNALCSVIFDCINNRIEIINYGK